MTSTLPEDMWERAIKRTHEWIRDCGLDVRDVEAFVDRELMPLLEEIAQETGKAYGGCHNCYGKGYASVNNSWHGHDTDGDIGSPGKYITGGDRNAMKFCTCERGQELERRFEETDRKAREEAALIADLKGTIEAAEQIWGVYTARSREDPNEPMFDFNKWLPLQIKDWKQQLAMLQSPSKENESTEWVDFTGNNYTKQYYDVRLPDGSIVKRCWPNAGYINGHFGSFGPTDDIQIRPSEETKS